MASRVIYPTLDDVAAADTLERIAVLEWKYGRALQLQLREEKSTDRLETVIRIGRENRELLDAITRKKDKIEYAGLMRRLHVDPSVTEDHALVLEIVANLTKTRAMRHDQDDTRVTRFEQHGPRSYAVTFDFITGRITRCELIGIYDGDTFVSAQSCVVSMDGNGRRVQQHLARRSMRAVESRIEKRAKSGV